MYSSEDGKQTVLIFTHDPVKDSLVKRGTPMVSCVKFIPHLLLILSKQFYVHS